jgi:hypothetical protein
LTAEALSELTQRPLLKVNLGRITSHKKWEQALEQIFFHAEDWNAILLIDEAEMVLEERTFERMTHNSWISGNNSVRNETQYRVTDLCTFYYFSAR